MGHSGPGGENGKREATVMAQTGKSYLVPN